MTGIGPLIVVGLLLDVAAVAASYLLVRRLLTGGPLLLGVRRGLCRAFGRHLRLDGLDDLWGECSICLRPL